MSHITHQPPCPPPTCWSPSWCCSMQHPLTASLHLLFHKHTQATCYLKPQLYKHGVNSALPKQVALWMRVTPDTFKGMKYFIYTLFCLPSPQDGAVHASLQPAEILYLTIAYDWFLFGYARTHRQTDSSAWCSTRRAAQGLMNQPMLIIIIIHLI